MKKGVIVYITGNVSDDWNEDNSEIIQHINSDADRVEVVAVNYGLQDIHYAWWKLIMNGIQSISCQLAVFDDADTLRLTGKELRLCG